MTRTGRPNILLITTDQQRWDAVGAHGLWPIQTPALDALARAGVSFRHGFCAAAACQPSRASLFTGVYPHVHGVTRTGGDRWLPPSLPMFSSMLGDAGYRTVAVGKMHAVPWDDPCGFQQRVIIESKYFPGPDEYRRHLARHGLTPAAVGHHTPGFGRANKAVPSPLDPDDHIDGYIGCRGVEQLDHLCASRQPWLLWVSFCGPHDPYDPPAPYDRLHDPQAMPLPRRAEDELDRVPPCVRTFATAFGRERMNLHGIPDAEVQRIRALYAGNVALIDRRIGEMLALLGRRGRADDTLVAFTSDHGDYLGDHDLLWKATLPTDSDMRVPLILRWPRRIRSTACDAFVSGVDVMPTLLHAAGVDPPAHLHGHSLLDWLDGAAPARQHLLMFAEPDKWRYRDRCWAYTVWPSQPFDTCYDLRADPDELDNLCRPGRQPPAEVTEVRRRVMDSLAAVEATVAPGDG